MRYLGIDYGNKHIGLAIGDDETKVAVPLETFFNKGIDVFCSEIQRIAQYENIGKCVVGVPALGAVFHEQRDVIENVVEHMRKTLSIPVAKMDESFTTREAQHLLREDGGAPDTDEHAVAAMLILQSYLDRIRRTEV